jgi:hypothetical protein
MNRHQHQSREPVRELIKTSVARGEGIDLANSPEYERRYGLRAQAYDLE